MKLLFIHVDRIWYRAKRGTKFAEETTEKEGSMNDCIVAFSCVEKYDEIKPDETINSIREEIVKVADKMKLKNIVVFPFAHLSQSLSHPEIALKILKGVESSLKESGFEVKRVPFGWSNEFELKSKGHPMAVLSRTICPIAEECDKRCPYCSGPLMAE
ncbi:MAG: threonyl-tRNA synthetase editing domain-containing protein [Candidatus Altiarchaeales archaeon]|nr:threonyl-tRNA synthetase editing domain-containing protein [Candidatus Altiarchaeota archaeon]MBU4342181.1 threonyl-tRNA synthetase editing domain-containing protein [Candidatus Altiarchaeota archaeon]MBU4406337.1 threonyl-tRNA synthetase editing domain-containing protein [Candidatus Altiarchaeota archaeon]MBU4436874.1 threonyl-tRNA synthetase editing domain-containing protein [Candidatus Altiarchaeota archaeon]MCG2782180.1 threonyl-tRNA synthetase editing domain-containing protein [Candidat